MTAYVPTQFQLQKTDDRLTDDLQRGFSSPIQVLQLLQPLNGVYLTTQPNALGEAAPIVFPAGLNLNIIHNLGRAYTGWLMARVQNVTGADAPWLVEAVQDASLNVFQVSLTNGSTSDFTCDLWVY